MATASDAACTHSCDLCGAGCARADLRRPGGTAMGRSAGAGKLPGDCPACQAHSLSELIAFIDATVAPGSCGCAAGSRGHSDGTAVVSPDELTSLFTRENADAHDTVGM